VNTPAAWGRPSSKTPLAEAVVSTGTETIRVQTTDTTLIQKYMPVTVGDLKVGEQVVVSGSRNDDGSYTARSIQSMRALPSVPSGQ
jgi:hypothetical protein